jgi:hypothetical protein
MAKKQVSWTRDWTPLDFTGFSPKKIRDEKAEYKAKAIKIIDAQIKKLGKRITYTLRWSRQRAKPFYYLLTYTKPPAKEIPKKKNGKGGGGGSIISPPAPPKP